LAEGRNGLNGLPHFLQNRVILPRLPGQSL
jgi:hypothetical protein